MRAPPLFAVKERVGMREAYDTVRGPAQCEFVEKRSRFIGYITPVGTAGEAADFLASIRARHHDARHNCHAFTLYDGGILRYSDDGEPQGTAGMPILEVIRREGLWNVAVVVTRYFGGILLGAGGLTRAYAHAAKLAVDAAERVSMCPCTRILLEAPYPQYERVLQLLQKHGAVVMDSVFTQSVTLDARLKTQALAGFEADLTEFSGGSIEVLERAEEFAAI